MATNGSIKCNGTDKEYNSSGYYYWRWYSFDWEIDTSATNTIKWYYTGHNSRSDGGDDEDVDYFTVGKVSGTVNGASAPQSLSIGTRVFSGAHPSSGSFTLTPDSSGNASFSISGVCLAIGYGSSSVPGVDYYVTDRTIDVTGLTPSTYTVTFAKGTGVTGLSYTTQTVSSGSTTTFPTVTGVSTGYDSSSVVFDSNSSYKPETSTPAITANTTFTATASKIQCTYSYVVNREGASGTSPSGSTKDYGSNITLPSSVSGLTSGYTLAGWTTSSTGHTATYTSGASYTLSGTVTFYAVYNITVTFAKGTGISSIDSDYSSKNVLYNTTTTFPPSNKISVQTGYDRSTIKFNNNSSYLPGSTTPAVTTPVTYTATASISTFTVTFTLGDKVMDLHWTNTTTGATGTSTTVTVSSGDSLQYYSSADTYYISSAPASSPVTISNITDDETVSITATGETITFNYYVTLSDGSSSLLASETATYGSTSYKLKSSGISSKQLSTSGTLSIAFNTGSGTTTEASSYTATSNYSFSKWDKGAAGSTWTWSTAPSGSTGSYNYTLNARYSSAASSYSNYVVRSPVNVPTVGSTSEGFCLGFFTEATGGTRVASNGQTGFYAPISTSGSTSVPTSVTYYAQFGTKPVKGMYLLKNGAWVQIFDWS